MKIDRVDWLGPSMSEINHHRSAITNRIPVSKRQRDEMATSVSLDLNGVSCRRPSCGGRI